jgi:hypothetical protein
VSFDMSFTHVILPPNTALDPTRITNSNSSDMQMRITGLPSWNGLDFR